MSDTESKKHRRGGRERRDQNAKQTGPAYITRAIPTYDIMGEENLLKIEAAADRILAEVGLDIRDDDECLALFRKSGAKVDGLRVRFEPCHLREVLKTAPREFVQHARNPARSVRIGGNSVVFSPAYGSPFVMDLDKGRRYGTLTDFQNFIKLAYASPWLHHSGGIAHGRPEIADAREQFRAHRHDRRVDWLGPRRFVLGTSWAD